MKLKTVEVNGATYAEVADGKPVFVADDGKEVPFDVVHTLGTITRLNGEAKSHRERAEKAEGVAKAFEGITDAEAARNALETVKNLSAGDLVKAEKVEEIKREARLAAEKQVANAAKASGQRIQELEKNYTDLAGQYDNEKISGAFANSKFIREKVAAPLDMVQAMFGTGFKREDGKLVGYDPSGNKIYSRTKPGELADFDEAIEMRIDAYPYKDQILKGSGSSGSGAQPGRGGNSGGKTMTQACPTSAPMGQIEGLHERRMAGSS